MLLRSNILVLIPLLCTACNFISFDEESVDCSISANQTYFEEQAVCFSFSSTPDTYQVEQSITMSSDSKAVEVKYTWGGTTLLVQPSAGWEKGKNYTIKFDGTFTLSGTRLQASIIRSFIYGQKDELLDFNKTGSICIVQNVQSPLVFVFSKALQESSFVKNFSLSPNVDFNISFSEDKKSVSVIPKTSWAVNTLYTWNFHNILSADGYYRPKEESGFFSPVTDTSLPQILTVCPVQEINNEMQFLSALPIDNNIREKDILGFIFSKPMDIDSVKNGITFTPSISGYIKQVDSSNTKFVFIPEAMFKIQQRYTISILSSVCDTNAITLYEQKNFFFTPAGSFFTIAKLALGTQEVTIPSDTEVSYTIGKNLLNKYELTAHILFSTTFTKQMQKTISKYISLALLFPLSSESPVLTQITWNSEGTKVSFTWENFTPSTDSVPCFYELTLTGGASGIQNGRGEYMEKNICVIIDPKA